MWRGKVIICIKMRRFTYIWRRCWIWQSETDLSKTWSKRWIGKWVVELSLYGRDGKEMLLCWILYGWRTCVYTWDFWYSVIQLDLFEVMAEFVDFFDDIYCCSLFFFKIIFGFVVREFFIIIIFNLRVDGWLIRSKDWWCSFFVVVVFFCFWWNMRSHRDDSLRSIYNMEWTSLW